MSYKEILNACEKHDIPIGQAYIGQKVRITLSVARACCTDEEFEKLCRLVQWTWFNTDGLEIGDITRVISTLITYHKYSVEQIVDYITREQFIDIVYEHNKENA